MVKMPDCGQEINEFQLQLSYYVPFQINTQGYKPAYRLEQWF